MSLILSLVDLNTVNGVDNTGKNFNFSSQ